MFCQYSLLLQALDDWIVDSFPTLSTFVKEPYIGTSTVSSDHSALRFFGVQVCTSGDSVDNSTGMLYNLLY